MKDTRHLWILAVLMVLVGCLAMVVRSQLVPKNFGQQGPYRTEALTEAAAIPSVFQSDATCHECHEDVREERAESLHNSVRCFHCHGIGREHVAQARLAEESPDAVIAPAEEWDGDFMTDIDLYVTNHRKACLVCHESKVGMPADFKQIVVAEHLEDQGASEPESVDVCFECHSGHDPAPY